MVTPDTPTDDAQLLLAAAWAGMHTRGLQDEPGRV